jgi:hypothetical protein
MPSRPFVIPIAEEDALAWAAGSVNDLYLLLRASLIPQAVFVGDLPDLGAYGLVVRQCQHWRRAGALGAVYRTSNEVLVRHFAPFGARATLLEADGRSRYILPMRGFVQWLDSLKLRRHAAPGETLRDPVSPPVTTPPE